MFEIQEAMSGEQYAFVILLAGFALFVGVSLWTRTRMMAVGFSLFAVAILVFSDFRKGAPSVDSQSGKQATRPLVAEREGFASSKQCRSCHPSQYESWHHSYHRTMTTLAAPDTVKGEFDNVVYSFDGLTFQMTRRGDEFWVEMDDPDHSPGSQARPERVERKIEMITGSHHMQVYWYASGITRQMRMLPISYLIGDKRWAPEEATFLRPPSADKAKLPGAWNINCIRCHATYGNPGKLSDVEMYSEVGEFGIACEACHAPAEIHAHGARNPLTRYQSHLTGAAGHSVVNPGGLDPVRASQVCGNCHGIHDVARIEDEAFFTHGFRFRPGDTLEPYRHTLHPSDAEYWNEVLEIDTKYIQNRYWSDGEVRVTGREYNGLVESPCFQHDDAERKMTCLSCHRMHPASDNPRDLEEWRDDQLGIGMRGNAACLQCHGEYSRKLEKHTGHAPESPGSLCYNCHMPHTTYGLMTAIRSHTVTSPDVEKDLQTGRPNACNQCHFDRTLAWAAEQLEKRYEIRAPRLSASDRTTAAAVRWSVRGDAGQRALMAWTFGWEDAKSAAGHDWAPFYLAMLMEDPYAVVRHMAYKSLRKLPGYSDIVFDYVAPVEERAAIVRAILSRWEADETRSTAADVTVLIDDHGKIDRARLAELLAERDNFPLDLAE